MNLYVSCDMEGVAGVIRKSQLTLGNNDYQEARKLLTGEVNALIEGAIEEGVDNIIVADMHHTGFNLLINELHPEAEYVLGTHKTRFPEIEKYDALVLLGYHAMAGTQGAVRDHTMSSTHWHDLYVNGKAMGEFGFDAAIAGHYGIPTIMVSGDDKVCEEARCLINGIITAQVKKGINRNSALNKSPVVSRNIIKSKVKQAIKNMDNIEPLRIKGEVEIMVRYNLSEQADQINSNTESIIRKSAREIIFKGDTYLDAVQKMLG